MSRLFFVAFRFLAAVFAILAVLLGVGAWRILSEPMSTTTLTPYIELVFERLIPDTQAQIQKSSVAWDNKKQILTVDCDDVRLLDEMGDKVAAFPTVHLRLKVWTYLLGRVLPTEFKAEGAHFWLTRHKNGALSLGSKEPVEEAPKGGVDAFSFLQNIADELEEPDLRQSLAIKDMRVSVSDLATQERWEVRVPEIALVHDKRSATGQAGIEIGQGGATVVANYHYDYKAARHNVALVFRDIRPAALTAQIPHLQALTRVDLPFSGRVSVATDKELTIEQAMAEIEAGKGVLRDSDLWDKPRPVESLAFVADYDRMAGKIRVSKADIDFGGPTLKMTFEGNGTPNNQFVWLAVRRETKFKAKIQLDNLKMDDYASVWPKSIIPDARAWIAANLTKGLFTHGEVNLEGKLKWDDLANLELTSGGGKISAQDGRVTYLEGMPAIEGASAEATFDLDGMDVKILGGSTWGIKLQPFVIRMSDFQEDVQNIVLPVRLAGPVSDVLRLIDQPPLGYAKAVGLNPSDSSGQVEGALTLKMPMLETLLLKDIDIKAEAKLTDFGVKNLIPRIEVSQGNLALDLNVDGFALKGTVGLNKVPAQLTWKTRFDEKQAKDVPIHEAVVNATVKGDEWRAFGLGETAQITGDTPVTVRYENVRKGLSRLKGEANLRGPSVQIEELGWNKPAGVNARLSVSLEMPEGKDVQIKTIDLQGQGIRVRGSGELDAQTGDVRVLDLRPFILGRSNAFVRYAAPADQTKPLVIDVEGESLDITGFRTSKKDEKSESGGKLPASRPKLYTIKLTKLHTSEQGYLSSVSVRARRDAIGWNEMDVWGLAQGAVPFDFKLLPFDGRMRLSIASDDFGVSLKGLGLTDEIKGGTLEVNGESAADNPRVIQGKVKIGSFTVADLPVLARLLSAVSPFGFMDLITGDASFDHLRGHFRWSGDDVELSEVRAAGSVVGINLDGRVNLDSGATNLSGTVVPFSFVNSIIGSIPLIGDVITGGSGQGVIAAAFTVKGTLAEPNVSVNPVSLLTPGFLRNLFFSADEPEETKKQE